MAMPAALARWHREHGTARHKSKSKHKRAHGHTRTRTVVKYRTRHAARAVARRARRAVRQANLTSAGVLVPVAALAAAYGYSSQNMPEFVDLMHKIPGVKTVGAPLVIAGIAYSINRWVYASKWLRIATAVGVVLAAAQWGKTKFEIPSWAGDVGDVGAVADVR